MLINRLSDYLTYKGVSAYLFERTCGLGNGYIGKQLKSKGSVGSDILQLIAQHYPDLDMNWLISGKGKMLMKPIGGSPAVSGNDGLLAREEAAVYEIKSALIQELKKHIDLLESSMAKKRVRSR